MAAGIITVRIIALNIMTFSNMIIWHNDIALNIMSVISTPRRTFFYCNDKYNYVSVTFMSHYSRRYYIKCRQYECHSARRRPNSKFDVKLKSEAGLSHFKIFKGFTLSGQAIKDIRLSDFYRNTIGSKI
jgi:hypothetical protein